MMAWCVGNARVEPKGNAILITKQASGKGKIDPLMALFNSVSLMALNPEAKKAGLPGAFHMTVTSVNNPLRRVFSFQEAAK
ncbi:Phage terminase-like protein, large subunit [Cronobacter sakazakii]|nr:Phage terminase-like protein, large subunit [Cronobacter sakazakii]